MKEVTMPEVIDRFVSQNNTREMTLPEPGRPVFIPHYNANLRFDQANYFMARAIDNFLINDPNILDEVNDTAVDEVDPTYGPSKVRSIISSFVRYEGYSLAIKRMDRVTKSQRTAEAVEEYGGGVVPIRHELVVALEDQTDIASFASASSAYPNDGPRRSIIYPLGLFGEIEDDLKTSLTRADSDVVSGALAVAASIDPSIPHKSVPRHIVDDLIAAA
jgi:hypothetical protein